MRALLVLLLAACGGVIAPPTAGSNPAPPPPRLLVTPPSAFPSGQTTALFDVQAKDFPGSAQPAWDRIETENFFFVGRVGPVPSFSLEIHSVALEGPMNGLLSVGLLEPRLRGESYLLCVGAAMPAPAVVCSDPVLFSQ